MQHAEEDLKLVKFKIGEKMDSVSGLDDLAFYLAGFPNDATEDVFEVLMDGYGLTYSNYREIISRILKLMPVYKDVDGRYKHVLQNAELGIYVSTDA